MAKVAHERVLVIDSDASSRGLLARVLTDRGCAVESAADGRLALAAFRRSSFALAVVDLELRGVSGSELAATIASKWPDTGVLVVARAEDITPAVASMKAGAYDYLSKPFHLADVVVRVARALERQRLILASKQHERQLEARARREIRAGRRLFLGAIKSLSSALEAKDDYTRGHSERVSRLAGEIAHAIGAGAEGGRRIRLAGRLHDIGKIGVRESVLAKPGALTEEEYRHIQTHPIIGERILAPALADAEILKMVRHHHERYTGGGYPDGLRGSDIPLGARVLAVADAFDALTSDRPYRERLLPPDALEVLRRGAGTQWQPTLVEALAQRRAGAWPVRGGEEGRGATAPGEKPTTSTEGQDV